MGNECPRCGEATLKDPIVLNSISIEDEKTYICSSCGINESRINFFKYKNQTKKIPKSQLEMSRKFREKLKIGNA